MLLNVVHFVTNLSLLPRATFRVLLAIKSSVLSPNWPLPTAFYWRQGSNCYNALEISGGTFYQIQTEYWTLWCITQIQIILTFELVKCHLRPRSSWLSLLQILHIDLLAYTSLFSMFAGLPIFFILDWKTREFDLNFASQKCYFLLTQLVFLCFW